MAYIDQANLGNDSDFIFRLSSALAEQAQIKDDALAGVILKNPVQGSSMFMPYISTQPGFGEAYATAGQEGVTDGMMLSAIQAVWADVAALYAAP